MGIKSKDMEQLFNEDQSGVTRWLRSKGIPKIPVRPMQHSMLKSSYSELFVKNLGAEFHSVFTAAKTLCL